MTIWRSTLSSYGQHFFSDSWPLFNTPSEQKHQYSLLFGASCFMILCCWFFGESFPIKNKSGLSFPLPSPNKNLGEYCLLGHRRARTFHTRVNLRLWKTQNWSCSSAGTLYSERTYNCNNNNSWSNIRSYLSCYLSSYHSFLSGTTTPIFMRISAHRWTTSWR